LADKKQNILSNQNSTKNSIKKDTNQNMETEELKDPVSLY